MRIAFLQKKDVRGRIIRIGVAESILSIGAWITMMAVQAMLVFRGSGGVAESSGIFLAGLLPALPGSLLAGKLCDRYDRKKLMIISLVLSAAAVSGLIFARRLELIYLLLGLEAVTFSIMTPARQSALPMLVSKDELTQANAFLQQLSAIIKIGAPMLAGLLLSVLDPHRAIILDVFAYLFAALILLGLPSLEPIKGNSSESVPGEGKIRGGFAPLIKIPALKVLFLLVFCGVFVLIGFDVLCSVYIRDVLKLDERFMGFAVGLVGVGTLLASVFLLLRKKHVNRWSDVVGGIFLLAVIPLTFFLAISMSTSPLAIVMTLAGCFIGGIGNGFLNIQSGTLLQILSPQESLGSVSGSFQSTMVAGQLLGTVLTPLLVKGITGMSTYFVFSTAVLVLLGVYLILQLKWWERNERNVSIQQVEGAMK